MSGIARPAEARELADKLVPMIEAHGPGLTPHVSGCAHDACENCPASRETDPEGSVCLAGEPDEADYRCDCGAWDVNRFYLMAVALVAAVRGSPRPEFNL